MRSILRPWALALVVAMFAMLCRAADDDLYDDDSLFGDVNPNFPSKDGTDGDELTGLPLYRYTECWPRFQAPLDGQALADARVQTLSWAQTIDDVTSTMKDYFNLNGNNVQLWRGGTEATLLYAGILNCGGTNMIPQPGLNADNVVISLILPSGVQKLTKVFPDTYGWDADSIRAVQGIWGITGTLLPEDYAYTTVGTLRGAVTRFENGGNGYAQSSIFIDAVRGDDVACGIVMGKANVGL